MITIIAIMVTIIACALVPMLTFVVAGVVALSFVYAGFSYYNRCMVAYAIARLKVQQKLHAYGFYCEEAHCQECSNIRAQEEQDA